MGLFSKLFGESSDEKKKLEEVYVPMFQTLMGMSQSQAKSTFHTLYSEAQAEAKREGSLNLPMNLGDILIEKETTDKNIHSMLKKRRKQGVTDEDIRSWMNRHELDRKMMVKVDIWFKFALFKKLVEEDGLDRDEATSRVKKFHPIFGDPDDATITTDDDKPLPFELMERVNIYIGKKADEENFKKEIQESSSFNALIRKEIKKGNI